MTCGPPRPAEFPNSPIFQVHLNLLHDISFLIFGCNEVNWSISLLLRCVGEFHGPSVALVKASEDQLLRATVFRRFQCGRWFASPCFAFRNTRSNTTDDCDPLPGLVRYKSTDPKETAFKAQHCLHIHGFLCRLHTSQLPKETQSDFLEFKDVVEKKLLIASGVVLISAKCGCVVVLPTGDDTLQYNSFSQSPLSKSGTKWPQLVLLPPCPLATRLASPQRLFQMHPTPS